jgi:coenzyme F420-reducing hydrogenase alpha subunit
MFHSIVARAVEIYCALLEAIRLLATDSGAPCAAARISPRAGTGFGCTEAPRGLLWHRYTTDAQGRIVSARIVPPTSQNQARIEADLRASLESHGLARTPEELRRRAETVIRNYDPCISCATHFLTLRVDDGG